MQRFFFLAAVLGMLLSQPVFAADKDLPAQARQALRKAVQFFGTQVAVEGGYVWRYSDDLAKREGEGVAKPTQVWIQPPGTPSVGQAFLAAYRATQDAYYLEMAKATGMCLVRGQLRSGGWDYSISFDVDRRKAYAYRVYEPVAAKRPPFNTTTLDDNNTQSALCFLIELDKTLEFKDAQIHGAVDYALKSLLAAQYPNGAWPQRFSEPPDPAKYPVKKAEYPATWSRIWPHEDYKSYYTFNDNTMADMISTMLLAGKIYNEPRYRASAEKGGDFVLLAQMPEPQPAWAQQYNAQMQPAWARKFEPPAVTGGESQGAMRILMHLYRETGNKKYLEPIPRALAYLKRSVLADGKLARFYELTTNRPLYFTKTYQLTYDDSDMPTHYAFKIAPGLEAIEREYAKLRGSEPQPPSPSGRPARPGKVKGGQVARVIAAMDERGAWVEDGKLHYHGADDTTRRVIDCRTFIVNVRLLGNYIEASR
jgi:hypothetical protein